MTQVEEDEFWKRYFWKQEIEETLKWKRKKNSNSNIEEAKMYMMW